MEQAKMTVRWPYSSTATVTPDRAAWAQRSNAVLSGEGCWMLPLATHCHTHFHLHPLHCVLFKFKDLVVKQHPINSHTKAETGHLFSWKRPQMHSDMDSITMATCSLPKEVLLHYSSSCKSARGPVEPHAWWNHGCPLKQHDYSIILRPSNCMQGRGTKLKPWCTERA